MKRHVLSIILRADHAVCRILQVDHQVAVPLISATSQRVTYLYDLVDAAYDAHAIREHSLALGHRPLTELVPRHRVVRTKVLIRKDSRVKKTVV